MPRTRKQTQQPMETKEQKLTAEELPVARQKKLRQPKAKAKKNEPVRISKYYFDKAVTKIRNHNSKQKQKHLLIEYHSSAGARALNMCHSFSLDTLSRSLVQPVNYSPTSNLIIKMLRRAILARNWSYCLRLCDAYLQCGTVRQRHLPHLFKLIFLLLLNSNVSGEHLNNFLNVTLSMRNHANQEAFLWSLIELKEFSSESCKTAEKDHSSSAPEKSDFPPDVEAVSRDDDASNST